MIAQITGNLVSKKATEIVVDCSGVGYLLTVSANTSEKLPEVGTLITIKTFLIPRDDALLLFGFADDVEREIFKMLLTVPGIGPKSAIAILSSVDSYELIQVIGENNLTLLQKIPGIGKKTAERILIDLRDKITKLGVQGVESTTNAFNAEESIAALIGLGHNKATAEKAVKKALASLDKDATIQDIIIASLKLAVK